MKGWVFRNTDLHTRAGDKVDGEDVLVDSPYFDKDSIVSTVVDKGVNASITTHRRVSNQAWSTRSSKSFRPDRSVFSRHSSSSSQSTTQQLIRPTTMHASTAAQKSQDAPGKEKAVVPVSSRMYSGRAMNLDVWSIYKLVSLIFDNHLGIS